MKKEEFIAYLEGIESMLETAGLEKLEGVITEVKEKASTIEVNSTYWSGTWPPYRPWYIDSWYNTAGTFVGEVEAKFADTVSEVVDTMSEVATEANKVLANTTGWSVHKLDNGDFEIVKKEE